MSIMPTTTTNLAGCHQSGNYGDENQDVSCACFIVDVIDASVLTIIFRCSVEIVSKRKMAAGGVDGIGSQAALLSLRRLYGI